MQWFRCYSDIADNYKLKMLAFEDRWHYIALLSCKSMGMLDGKRQEFVFRTVAMRLGLSKSELEEVSRRLAEYNLIDAKTLQPKGWNERQFISDNSTPRSRKSRNKKKTCNVPATAMQRNCNVPDTDTDTDTDTESYTDTEKDKNLIVDTDSSSAKTIPPCPVDKIIEIYNQTLPLNPQCKIRTASRDKNITARWRQFFSEGEFQDVDGGLDCFAWYFGEVKKSRFLTGQTDKPFRPDLEWLTKAGNFAKVVEGKYHGN